ncbi:MAG: PHP domain-containing protein [Clostridia bacterium]|nr:PHP domain-containing protein [Clostridia bacterium]
MIDLHTHTTASDGSLTPEQLVKKAKLLGITHLGITDHDSINGVGDALSAGEKYGVTIVPGVELGTDYLKTETHILGYFNKQNYMNIKPYFDWILEKRDQRNLQLIENLQHAGFSVSIEEVMKKADGGTPGRPHIAQLLIEKGYVMNIDDAFSSILLREDIYVKREKTTPKSAIQEIVKAGGIPVLAHPVYLDMENEFENALTLFISYGLKGIEVYHSDHKKEHEDKYMSAANKYHLLMTGGSDYHGDNKDKVILGGVKVPEHLVFDLLQALG